MPSPSPKEEEIYLAAVEGGGTTFVVSVARVIAVADDDDEDDRHDLALDDDGDDIIRIGPASLRILHSATIPSRDADTGELSPETMSPSQIIDEACSFLRRHRPPSGKYSAAGIATFGPAGVDPANAGDYGTILMGSPKKEWRGVDLLTPIAEACGLGCTKGRVGFDTDVNAPAVAEFRHRRCLQEQQQQHQQPGQRQISAKPLTSLSYVTVGTGVGVGLVINSEPVHGLLHPEGGQVAIRPLDGDGFGGYSWGTERGPYGGVGTVEGVASSVALTERYLWMERGGGDEGGGENDDGASDARTREVLSTLPDAHPVWSHAANALANLCVSLLLLTSVQRIVLGGGIMNRAALFPMVRRRTWELLNGYLEGVEELGEEGRLEDVIVGTSWGRTGSGVAGAFALALDAHERERGVGGGNEEEEEEAGTARPSTAIRNASVIEEERKKRKEEDERRSFTSGVLAGIGLSFGCVLVTSLLGQGPRRGR